jgi:hypothetical protein
VKAVYVALTALVLSGCSGLGWRLGSGDPLAEKSDCSPDSVPLCITIQGSSNK